MISNYYKVILDTEWEGFEDCVKFFQRRCDSQLEVLFALAFVTRYRDRVIECQDRDEPSCYDINLADDVICLVEPFHFSPSGNGVSIAYLKPQVQHEGYTWDFGIYTANNNGAEFGECTLSSVIDIDGWAVHRGQRTWDQRKLTSAKVHSIRVLEELFIDAHEMAMAVMNDTIFDFEDCEIKPSASKLHHHYPKEDNA